MWLLDTHLVLWAAFGPQRLPRRARQLIESREDAVAFSDATLWEVAFKSSLRKPGFEVDAAALRDGLLAAGFDE
ncbi:MAG TPA: PIN domain nuclease, partial [Rubrivivax sp.]|nr:PIN domain nuclease [Rubrivivax sp.]